jgi:hypothetical protein
MAFIPNRQSACLNGTSTQTTPPLWVELLLLCEVPEEHKVATSQVRRDAARQLGCRPRDVKFELWLMAPECHRARAYEQWFKSLDPEIQEWSVPLQIVSRQEYAVRTGHTDNDKGIAASVLEFSNDWNEVHRPKVYGLQAVRPDPVLRLNE